MSFEDFQKVKNYSMKEQNEIAAQMGSKYWSRILKFASLVLLGQTFYHHDKLGYLLNKLLKKKSSHLLLEYHPKLIEYHKFMKPKLLPNDSISNAQKMPFSLENSYVINPRHLHFPLAPESPTNNSILEVDTSKLKKIPAVWRDMFIFDEKNTDDSKALVKSSKINYLEPCFFYFTNGDDILLEEKHLNIPVISEPSVIDSILKDFKTFTTFTILNIENYQVIHIQLLNIKEGKQRFQSHVYMKLVEKNHNNIKNFTFISEGDFYIHKYFSVFSKNDIMPYIFIPDTEFKNIFTNKVTSIYLFRYIKKEYAQINYSTKEHTNIVEFIKNQMVSDTKSSFVVTYKIDKNELIYYIISIGLLPVQKSELFSNITQINSNMIKLRKILLFAEKNNYIPNDVE